MGSGKNQKHNSRCHYDTGLTVVISDENNNNDHTLSLSYMNTGNNHYENLIYYSKTGSYYYRDDGCKIETLEKENIVSEEYLYSNYIEF